MGLECYDIWVYEIYIASRDRVHVSRVAPYLASEQQKVVRKGREQQKVVKKGGEQQKVVRKAPPRPPRGTILENRYNVRDSVEKGR